MERRKSFVKSTLTMLTDGQGERYTLSREHGSAGTFAMEFVVVFDEPYVRICRQIKSVTAHRIFAVLRLYLSFKEFRHLGQQELAAEMKLSQGAVSRALNELADVGAIERRGTGPMTTWRLSMEWGWKGTPKSFHAERAKRAKAGEKVVRLKPQLTVVTGGADDAA
jgi:DNA-binding transcriptional ArsR family regulator